NADEGPAARQETVLEARHMRLEQIEHQVRILAALDFGTCQIVGDGAAPRRAAGIEIDLSVGDAADPRTTVETEVTPVVSLNQHGAALVASLGIDVDATDAEVEAHRLIVLAELEIGTGPG